MLDALRATTKASVVFVAASLAVLVIGAIDYATGVEVRVYPLYFIPIALSAWHGRALSAVAIAFLSTVAWIISNRYAGLSFSHVAILSVNTLMQGGSFVLVALLIAGLREGHARERALSLRDPLTGLLNTRAFYREAPRLTALARRHGRPVTLAFVDLDNFKSVNDTLGHTAGDRVLREVADVLAVSLREGDLVCRVGGDEFVLLMPDTGGDGARALLGRVVALLREKMCQLDGVTDVTVSVGAVSYAPPPEDLDAMVRAADALMYRAKAGGKDRVLFEDG